jgi:elongation factor G
MAVEVVCPEDYMGDVIGDLNSRRGQVKNMDQRGTRAGHHGRGAARHMFGYATDLRRKTQGRATYTMQFSHYDPSRERAEEIVAKVKGRP